jgi:hypothetical protein
MSYVPSSSVVPEPPLLSTVQAQVLKTAPKPSAAKGHGRAWINHVQHRSAAARQHLVDRSQPLASRPRPQKAFSDPAATSYGSEGWGFESLRARPGQRPLPIMEGAFLLTRMLTAAIRRPS